MAYEDALWTRVSHYSYEIHDNKLRIFPTPDSTSPEKFWVQFTINNQYEPWDNQPGIDNGAEGVNNLNTLPFENIPYENINAIGKQWIRRFALALTKEILGQVRGKFSTVHLSTECISFLPGSQLFPEIEFMPSSLETIDRAMLRFIDEELNLFTNTNDGFKKVPVLWVTAERAFQIKHNKDLRDKEETLILPLITVNRSTVTKEQNYRGTVFANLYPVDDEKGGTITVARQINQKKTAEFLLYLSDLC